MTINHCFKGHRGNGLQSTLPFHGLINSLKSFATAALVVIYSPLASAVEPLVYSTTVNHAEQTAIFQIKFDSKPNFFTAD